MGVLARLSYPLRSGRRSKAAFFACGTAGLFVPDAFFRNRRRARLEDIEGRPDEDEIRARAAYCCRWERGEKPLPADAPPLGALRFPRSGHAYWFDVRSVVRYFPRTLRWRYEPGDVTEVPPAPTVVKSRPVAGDNRNATLLALNTVRHFVFVRDRVATADKEPRACFRGKVQGKALRRALFERWFGHPMLDLGDTAEQPVRPEWARPKMTLAEQLRYRFILSVEGNDVASNLKWILSSNAVAVMPRPRFETCFEEGRLVPGVHYAEIAPDFSDLPDVIRFLAARPALCERIAAAGRAWAARFHDPERERLVALLTMQRYFLATGQDPDETGRADGAREEART